MSSSVYSLSSEDFSFLLLDLREKFGQLFLYTIDKHKYVLRPLYLSEMESIAAITASVPDYIIDEWAVNKTLLGTTASESHLKEDGLAGTLSILAMSIIKLSSPGGVAEINAELEKQRQNLSSDLGVIQTTMLAGTGNILGKNYTRITAREQTKYLAIAESIVGKKLEVQTVAPVKEKKGKVRKLTPEVAAMLSKEAADKPDIDSDNKMLRGL